jgi:hypothetical protein
VGDEGRPETREGGGVEGKIKLEGSHSSVGG